jgi:N-methylhydantoinase A/oxoprolinase/acetone carboxylase beta subunit
MRVGVDTGGTFTDVVTDGGRIAKVPSTPADPGEAVRSGVAAVSAEGSSRPATLAHGTTVATNAVLERRGAVVTLVTNEGFADLVEIARQDRPIALRPLGRPARAAGRRPDRVEVPGAWAPTAPSWIPSTSASIGPLPE